MKQKYYSKTYRETINYGISVACQDQLNFSRVYGSFAEVWFTNIGLCSLIHTLLKLATAPWEYHTIKMTNECICRPLPDNLCVQIQAQTVFFPACFATPISPEEPAGLLIHLWTGLFSTAVATSKQQQPHCWLNSGPRIVHVCVRVGCGEGSTLWRFTWVCVETT